MRTAKTQEKDVEGKLDLGFAMEEAKQERGFEEEIIRFLNNKNLS